MKPGVPLDGRASRASGRKACAARASRALEGADVYGDLEDELVASEAVLKGRIGVFVAWYGPVLEAVGSRGVNRGGKEEERRLRSLGDFGGGGCET